MVKIFLKIEFSRAFLKWQTLIAFLIFIFVFIHISINTRADIPMNYSEIYQLELGNPFIIYLEGIGGFASYMPFLLPLIIMFIIGDSLYKDYKTGFLQFNLTRISYKKFIFYKTIATSIVSGIITFLFQLCAFIYSIITSPYHLPTNTSLELNIAPSSSTDIYLNNPYIYILLTILVLVSVAMTFSIVGLISSSLFKNSFSVIGVPWVIYLIASQVFIFLAPEINYILYYMSPIRMVGPFMFDYEQNIMLVLLYWTLLFIILFFISRLLFVKKFKSGSWLVKFN